jgi:hypothetical protein
MENRAVSEIDNKLKKESQNDSAAESSGTPEGWQREVRCPISGRWVVASRPGERKVTSEEIYRMLREEEDIK